LDHFLDSIGPLADSKGRISGDAAVLGGGVLLPEVTLLCTPESQFTIPGPEITSITCVDKSSSVYLLDMSFNIPEQQVKILGYGECAENFTIGLMWTNLEHFLHHLPENSFDTILMFRHAASFIDIF